MLPKYYEILKISKTATAREIALAYKKLSLQWHPDKNPDQAELATETFLAISKAYEILSDRTKRFDYDQQLIDEETLEALKKQQKETSSSSVRPNNPFPMPSKNNASPTSAPQKPSAPPQRIPKITEIYEVEITQELAVKMINQATKADLEFICQLILQQLSSKANPARANIEHLLFALLTRPGAGQSEAIKKLDPKNCQLFIVNLVIFYHNQPTMMTKYTLEFLKKYFALHHASESATRELLHKLAYLYSDIFYSDLTLENAITIFASEKTNKEGLFEQEILDFLKVYLDSGMSRYANNAKCLLWAALAVPDIDKILHHHIANYIQAETWIYFDALKKDVQIKIIEHLLHIVHGKYDDYRGRVTLNCANFILSYLQKNDVAQIPHLLIDLCETHNVPFNFKMSKAQYLQFLSLKPTEDTIRYYFGRLTFDVQCELLGETPTPSQQLSPYQPKVMEALQNPMTQNDALAIVNEITHRRSSRWTTTAVDICNFIINHLQSDDPFHDNAEILLTALCKSNNGPYSPAISQLKNISVKTYDQFIDHLIIALYARNITETLRKEIHNVLISRLYVSDPENAPLLMKRLGRSLQTMWYTHLSLESACALFMQSEQSKNKDEKRLTDGLIFDFITHNVNSSHPHFSQNAKTLVFAALLANDSAACPHNKLSAYLVPEYQAYFYTLVREMQAGIINHLLKVVEDPGYLGKIDKNGAILVIDYLAQQLDENLFHVLIKIYDAHQHSIPYKLTRAQYATFKQLNPSQACDRYYLSLMKVDEDAAADPMVIDTPSSQMILNQQTPVLAIHQVLINYHLKPDVAILAADLAFFLEYFKQPASVSPAMIDPVLRSAGELLNRLHNDTFSFDQLQKLIVHETYMHVSNGEQVYTLKGLLFLRLLAQFIEHNLNSENNHVLSHAVKLVFAGLTLGNQKELSHGFLSKYIKDDDGLGTFAVYIDLLHANTICKNLMQALIEDNIDVKGIHFLLNRPRRVLETCCKTTVDILKLAYDKGHRITYKLSNEDLMTWVRLRDVTAECRVYYLSQLHSNHTSSSASGAASLQQYPRGHEQSQSKENPTHLPYRMPTFF